MFNYPCLGEKIKKYAFFNENFGQNCTINKLNIPVSQARFLDLFLMQYEITSLVDYKLR